MIAFYCDDFGVVVGVRSRVANTCHTIVAALVAALLQMATLVPLPKPFFKRELPREIATARTANLRIVGVLQFVKSPFFILSSLLSETENGQPFHFLLITQLWAFPDDFWKSTLLLYLSVASERTRLRDIGTAPSIAE